MKRLIVFDLDGTLLDTLADLTASVNYAMRELSLPTYTSAQVRNMVGNGLVKLMSRAVADRQDLHESALAFQRKYYSVHTDDYTKPYDGVESMLSELKANGFTIAVHTNKDEDFAKSLIARYFGEKVDFVCGTTSDVIKPNPEKITRLMETLQISAEHAVYCGDSDVDVQTARNAGVECISVTWGFRDREFLTEHGATHFANSPKDVLSIALALTK